MRRTRGRTGYATISADVDVDVNIDEVIGEATDEQLRAELLKRSCVPSPPDDVVEAMRSWRDALEAGAAPHTVAALIRAFMYRNLPPVEVSAPTARGPLT
jgi:hypothetical protein